MEPCDSENVDYNYALYGVAVSDITHQKLSYGHNNLK